MIKPKARAGTWLSLSFQKMFMLFKVTFDAL